MFLSSNLKILRKRRKCTQEELAVAIHVKRSTINNYENGVGQPSLENLLALSGYFNISIDTLIKIDLTCFSDGQLLELELGFDSYAKGSNLRVLSTTIDSENNENIEIVPVKARAGYTAGYNDPEFVKSLPVFQLPLLSRDRKYRSFQLDGDSMLPIPNGAYVIAEYVQDWTTIKDGHAFVMLTFNEGIVFKIVYNQLRAKKNFLLKSLNPIYKDYEVSLNEVKEVWKFVNYLSTEIPEPDLAKSDLIGVISNFEQGVNRIKYQLSKGN